MRNQEQQMFNKQNIGRRQNEIVIFLIYLLYFGD